MSIRKARNNKEVWKRKKRKKKREKVAILRIIQFSIYSTCMNGMWREYMDCFYTTHTRVTRNMYEQTVYCVRCGLFVKNFWLLFYFFSTPSTIKNDQSKKPLLATTVLVVSNKSFPHETSKIFIFFLFMGFGFYIEKIKKNTRKNDKVEWE